MDTNTLYWILILVTGGLIGVLMPYDIKTFRYWLVLGMGTAIQNNFWAMVLGIQSAFISLYVITIELFIFGVLCILVGAFKAIYNGISRE